MICQGLDESVIIILESPEFFRAYPDYLAGAIFF